MAALHASPLVAAAPSPVGACPRGDAERVRDEIGAMGRRLSNTSHELRTPLNGILGMADLLAGTGLDPEQEGYVAAIRSAGAALAQLVDGILDLARIEAGRMEADCDEVARDPYDPVRLVEGVVELLAPSAQAKGLEIAALVGAEVPARIEGDAVKLRQVLINLVGNAVKFTRAGGVGVRVAAEAGELRFTVEDTGPGVPADRRAAIFEDYERQRGQGGGAGLGLAISRRLAERMGGTLMVEGRDGGGAAFTLAVPALLTSLPADAEGCDAGGQAPAKTALTGTRVLVASASPFQAPFVARHLAEAGAAVTWRADPAAALRALAELPRFDTVVIDCALGDAALLSLAAAARDGGATRTAVMFSPAERRLFGPAAGRGFDGWLVKPVRRHTLLALAGSTLPPARAVRPVRPAPPSAPAPSRLAVLLAEDDDVSALVAMRHLARLGATVVHTADGADALALLEAAMAEGRPFAAAVLDNRMPGLGGLEVARRLRRAEAARGLPPCRIAMLSGDADELARQGGEIDAVVGKPVVFDRLAEALLLEPRPANAAAGVA